MVQSNKIYSPQSYLELVLEKTYIVSGDDDVDFIEKILEEHGECLWNYPLSEIDHVLENELDVVLVECMVYNQETHEYDREYRWFEVDAFTDHLPNKTNKYFFDVIESFVKTVAIEAEDLDEAKEKIKEVYESGKIKINREYYDNIYFKPAQKAVQECINEGFFAEDELDTF